MAQQFSGGKVKLSAVAYGKMFLHTARHFDCPILGLLIGTSGPDGEVLVKDVLPICHSIPAGPMIEIAGCMADGVLSGTDRVLGVYFAADRLNNESTPSLLLENVLTGVERIICSSNSSGSNSSGGNSSKCCYRVQIKNKLLASREKLFVDVSVINSNNSGSTVKSCKCELSENFSAVNSLLDEMLQQRLQHNCCDVEDHLNSSSSNSSSGDFRNAAIAEFIRSKKLCN